jgi:hypothetical protein
MAAAPALLADPHGPAAQMLARPARRASPGSSFLDHGRGSPHGPSVAGARIGAARRQPRPGAGSAGRSTSCSPKPKPPASRSTIAGQSLCPPCGRSAGRAAAAGMVLTFVDLGPRLITVTHHDAITGPYHRNGQQIVDVMNALARRRRQCPRHGGSQISCRLSADLPEHVESTIFMSEAPKGFYMQLQRGQVPAWLRRCAAPRTRRSGCGEGDAG